MQSLKNALYQRDKLDGLLTYLYAKLWYNALFYCGGCWLYRKIGLIKLMKRIYGYK